MSTASQGFTNHDQLLRAMQGLDITQYLDYRLFLEDLYKNSQTAGQRGQATGKPLSYAKLSILLGFKAENHFFLILKGHRGLTLPQAQIMARNLSFTQAQEKFLEMLVCYCKENDTQKKQEWLDKLVHLRQRRKLIKDSQLDKFLSSWLNGIVFEILKSKDQNWTLSDIRHTLKHNESITKIKQSLDILMELGLCYQENETYRAAPVSDVLSENTVHSASVAHFYNEILEGASRSLMSDSPEERLMQTLTITLPAHVKDKFGSLMDAFSKEIRSLASQNPCTTEQVTFQASLILFPVSQVISNKDK